MITGWFEMAIFAREIIGREVVDAHNEKLGLLTDLIIDKQSGSVTIAVVKLESNLDPNLLPWEHEKGAVRIPIDDVSRISRQIHLKR